MAQSEFNLQLMDEFRANGGQVVTGPFKDSQMLLLTTTGRKTGQRHTTPMGYTVEDGGMYVMTTNALKPVIPQWFFNLVANPEVTLEVGTETYQARAEVQSDEASEAFLQRFAEREPRLKMALEMMAANAAPNPRRRIPVVRFERLPA